MMEVPIVTTNQEELRKQTPEGTLAINEIFYSIQGEGKHAGVPMIFIRTNFCRVACKFCDTKYTWRFISHNQFLKPEEVLEKVRELSTKCRYVCITGGEPLEQDDALYELCKFLTQNGYKVNLETSGSMIVPEKYRGVTNWIVCSPKAFNRMNFISPINEVKILVKDNTTTEYVRSFISNFKERIWISIQPIEPTPHNYGNIEGLSPELIKQWKEEVEELRQTEDIQWKANKKRAIEICKETGWNLSFQIHKYLGIR